jgi:hypothetical protein
MTIENRTSAILSVEAYVAIRYKPPYCYLLRGTKSLMAFGTRHLPSGNTQDALAIWEALYEFGPSLVVIECCPPVSKNIDAQSRRSFVSEFGRVPQERALSESEQKVAVVWSAHHNVDVICPEPSFRLQIELLGRRGFSPEQIAAYFVFRDVAAEVGPGHLLKATPRFLQSLATFKEYKDDIGLEVSEGKLFELYDQLIAPELNRCGRGQALFDPTLTVTSENPAFTNIMARALNEFRNEEICALISRERSNYDRIFVLYGASHIVMVEPELRKMAENDTY